MTATGSTCPARAEGERFVALREEPDRRLQAPAEARLQAVGRQARDAAAGSADGRDGVRKRSQPPSRRRRAPRPRQARCRRKAVMQAQALLADVQQGIEQRQMIDKHRQDAGDRAMGYYVSEAKPGFKLQMKQMVRRARTTGVGYVKLGFQREMDLSEKQTPRRSPTFAERLASSASSPPTFRTAKSIPIRRRRRSCGWRSPPSRAARGDRREGLTFDFPHSTKIIPSISTAEADGLGRQRVDRRRNHADARPIKEVYGVDVGKSFTAYKTSAARPRAATRASSRSHQGRPGLRLSRLRQAHRHGAGRVRGLSRLPEGAGRARHLHRRLLPHLRGHVQRHGGGGAAVPRSPTSKT
jgi:hypothetical protein